MAQHTTYSCDRCGEPVDDPKPLEVWSGRPSAPSRDDWKTIDLCQKCATHLVSNLLRDADCGEAVAKSVLAFAGRI